MNRVGRRYIHPPVAGRAPPNASVSRQRARGGVSIRIPIRGEYLLGVVAAR